MGTLQALLSEMSGLSKPRGFMNRVVRRALGFKPKPPPKYRILIMMATNMPNTLDDALLRPGRIDRIYKVGYPSKAGRVRTYQGYFDKVSHELTAADIDKLATITPYATGATIKDLVNESLIVALRRDHPAITWADVLEAKRLKDLGPPEDVEYVERERHAVAIHEACHAVVAYRVRKHLEIDLATIEKGGTYLGMVSSIKPEDRFTSWRSEYEADVMVSLASLAGERKFFAGDSSSGVSGDLESATMIASLMEGYWGMGDTIASQATRRSGGGWPPGQGDGDMMRGDAGKKVEERLHELLAALGRPPGNEQSRGLCRGPCARKPQDFERRGRRGGNRGKEGPRDRRSRLQGPSLHGGLWRLPRAACQRPREPGQDGGPAAQARGLGARAVRGPGVGLGQRPRAPAPVNWRGSAPSPRLRAVDGGCRACSPLTVFRTADRGPTPLTGAGRADQTELWVAVRSSRC